MPDHPFYLQVRALAQGDLNSWQQAWIYIGLTLGYSVVPVALSLIAYLQQFTDLGRRELRGMGLVYLSVVLTLLLTLNVGFLLRDLNLARASFGTDCLCVGFVGIFYLYCHYKQISNLERDVFSLPQGSGVKLWKWLGYVGILASLAYPLAAFGLRGSQPTLSRALLIPSLPLNWPLAETWIGGWRLPTLFFAASFVAYALYAAYLAQPKNLRREAQRFANGNLCVLHFLAALITYGISLISEGSLKIGIPLLGPLSLFLIAIAMGLSRLSHARLQPAREADSQPWPRLPSQLSQNLVAKRGDLGEAPEFVLLTAEGGGIHATYRTFAVLSELDLRSEGRFWNQLDLISSVSGGSIAAACYRLLLTGRHQEASHDVARFAHQIGQSDLLLPPLLRLTFTDPWIPAFPSWRGLDRSKGLEEAVRLSIQDAQRTTGRMERSNAIKTPVSMMLSEAAGAGPEHYFNATSVRAGGRFILGTSALDTWPSNLTSGPANTDLDLITAASLSARFPIITSSGLLWLGPDAKRNERTQEWFERLVDGGAYDNTGIDVVLRVIRTLRRTYPRATFKVVAITDLYQGVLEDLKAFQNQETRPLSGTSVVSETSISQERDSAKWRHLNRTWPLEGFLSFLYVGLSSINNRNLDATRSLAELELADDGVEVIPFTTDLGDINAPLGWYLDGSRANAIRYMLGCEGFFEPDGTLRPFSEDPLVLTQQLQIQDSSHGRVADVLGRLTRLRRNNLDALSKLV